MVTPNFCHDAMGAWTLEQQGVPSMREEFKDAGHAAVLAADDALSASAALELRFSGFHPDYLETVRDLSTISPRVGELAESFPALLFAFATGFGDHETRHKAFDMVVRGDSLKKIASTYGLAYWLRRLPAQAFTSPLSALPDGVQFNRMIANCFPKSSAASASWFERISDAYTFAGVDYMLWMARQKKLPFSGDGQHALVLLGAWAWVSSHPECFAHSLLRQPWTPEMSFKRAYEEARAWERRIDLAITLGRGQRDVWFEGSTINGFDFVPLRTVEDFLAESKRMGNCLDQYASPINNTHVRVFSVRRDGETVANLELAPHDDDCLMPGIEQLRGPRNNRAAPEVWQAAYAWMGQQTFRVFPGPSHGTRPEVAEIWDRVWTPVLNGIATTPLRKRVRHFARQAHGSAGVQREASRINLEI